MQYKEIFKLKNMLEEANIPFEFRNMLDGYIIYLNKGIDVIEHHGSYGHENDLLEIMGGLTVEELQNDEVLGWLTAEEVFKRFKYCYENNTDVYVAENNSNKTTIELPFDVSKIDYHDVSCGVVERKENDETAYVVELVISGLIVCRDLEAARQTYEKIKNEKSLIKFAKEDEK